MYGVLLCAIVDVTKGYVSSRLINASVLKWYLVVYGAYPFYIGAIGGVYYVIFKMMPVWLMITLFLYVEAVIILTLLPLSRLLHWIQRALVE